MNEQQADKIIELLQSINRELSESQTEGSLAKRLADIAFDINATSAKLHKIYMDM